MTRKHKLNQKLTKVKFNFSIGNSSQVVLDVPDLKELV